MIIGTVKEIKNHEYRVGITPDNAKEYIKNGHTVLVEANAGAGAGFSDSDYQAVGAKIINSAKEVYNSSDMIIKVKEPLVEEYQYLREGLILYTYLHLAADKKLAKVLLENKVTAIAYETIEDINGGLPCLRPMSEIAGRLSVQEGAKYIESTYGGSGILLGGVTGVAKGKIVIIGGGIAGTFAAKAAVGIGARVTVLDNNLNRLAYLDDIFGNSIETLYSNEKNLESSITGADLVIGSVLIPGGSTPKLIKEEYVKKMKKGSVIVDIAIDQGGCCETSIVTTHDNPVYVKHGVVHYCVGNMPGAVPNTSTIALTNITTAYGILLANNGIDACKNNLGLAKGVNIINGYCVNENVAKALNLEYVSLNDVLNK